MKELILINVSKIFVVYSKIKEYLNEISIFFCSCQKNSHKSTVAFPREKPEEAFTKLTETRSLLISTDYSIINHRELIIKIKFLKHRFLNHHQTVGFRRFFLHQPYELHLSTKLKYHQH